MHFSSTAFSLLSAFTLASSPSLVSAAGSNGFVNFFTQPNAQGTRVSISTFSGQLQYCQQFQPIVKNPLTVQSLQLNQAVVILYTDANCKNNPTVLTNSSFVQRDQFIPNLLSFQITFNPSQ